VFEGTNGGENIDGDTENGGHRGEEAEAPARYQERVCSVSYRDHALFLYVAVSGHFLQQLELVTGDRRVELGTEWESVFLF